MQSMISSNILRMPLIANHTGFTRREMLLFVLNNFGAVVNSVKLQVKFDVVASTVSFTVMNCRLNSPLFLI